MNPITYLMIAQMILAMVKPWLGEGKVYQWFEALLDVLLKGARSVTPAASDIPMMHALVTHAHEASGPTDLDKADAAEAVLREALSRTRLVNVLKRSLLRAMIERVPAAIKEGKTRLSKKDGGDELARLAGVAKTRKAEWE